MFSNLADFANNIKGCQVDAGETRSLRETGFLKLHPPTNLPITLPVSRASATLRALAVWGR